MAQQLFKVTVAKKMYVSGYIKVKAKDPDDALRKVNSMRRAERNRLHHHDERIVWGLPEYGDDSLEVTGDVDFTSDD